MFSFELHLPLPNEIFNQSSDGILFKIVIVFLHVMQELFCGFVLLCYKVHELFLFRPDV